MGWTNCECTKWRRKWVLELREIDGHPQQYVHETFPDIVSKDSNLNLEVRHNLLHSSAVLVNKRDSYRRRSRYGEEEMVS
jgi:hypothetical protein